MTTNAVKNAIILAAGQGTRLKPITDNAPKCFTEVNGTTIMDNMLGNLDKIGIRECTIVTGYLADKITEKIGNSYGALKISYVHNDRYMETNDMYSLWLASDTLKRGAVILESDIFFRTNTLKKAMENMNNRSFYLAGKYNGKKGEVLIKTDKDKKITELRVLKKEESAEIAENHYMSSGILVVQPDYGTELVKWLTDAVNKNNIMILFDHVIGENITKKALHVFEIKQNEWVEIDTHQDLSRAEEIFK